MTSTIQEAKKKIPFPCLECEGCPETYPCNKYEEWKKHVWQAVPEKISSLEYLNVQGLMTYGCNVFVELGCIEPEKCKTCTNHRRFTKEV